MFPTSAALAGLGLAFAVFAALSGGLLIGLPVLVVVGVVVFRAAPAAPTGARAPRWVPWAAVGVAFAAASSAVIAAAEDEFTALEWVSILGLPIVGLWALGTALVLAVDARRSHPGPALPV